MVKVQYTLSAAGQREAIRRGVPAAAKQVIETNEALDRWTALEQFVVDSAGQAYCGVGVRTTYPDGRGGNYVSSPAVGRHLRTETIDGIQYATGFDHASTSDHAFDRPMTPGELLDWEEARVAGLVAQRAALDARIDADRPGYNTAKAAAFARELEAARTQLRELLVAAEADGVPAGHAAVVAAMKALGIDKVPDRYILDDVRKAIADEQKAKAARAYVDERARWASEHGSDHLRNCIELGLDADRIYRDERLAHDRPGWMWDRAFERAGFDIDLRAPKNPPPEAVALLLEARKTEPAAELQFAVLTHEKDDRSRVSESLKELFGAGPLKTYVCAARFLGDEMLYTGDQPELDRFLTKLRL